MSVRLHDAVNDGLAQKWSPEQVPARPKIDYPNDPEMRVCHETIYQTLYLQARSDPELVTLAETVSGWHVEVTSAILTACPTPRRRA